jgi:poly(glycerol-phosphate) alpha-glucosyltransferase
MQNRSEKSVRLPAGRHFAVTWSVPVMHGGRTNAMLQRSRAFASEAGAQVEILTFDSFRNYREIRLSLTAQGKLTADVTIRNIWEDLPDIACARPVLPAQELIGFSPLGETGRPVATAEGGPRRRTQRFAFDGTTLLQTDYLREDRTLFLSDRGDVNEAGKPGGRSLTLCDGQGNPVKQWKSAWALYRFWMDHLAGGEESYFVVDNKHAATFMTTYRRRTATVLLLVHDSHLANAAQGPASALSSAGQVLFPRFDSYDGVVLLTDMQAEDVRARVGDVGNFYVIPNSRAQAPVRAAERVRNPSAGVLLAQLTPRKQIDHAIRAVSEASQKTEPACSLAIYGEGTEESKLRNLIDALDASAFITLEGHTHSPEQVFEESSFSLLTSSSESFGLVLVESMAAGCIPIAYDIHYGPASIITHGVNGFIVERGNEQALSQCIVDFLAQTAEEAAAMRVAAIARAADFSEGPVVALWSQTLSKAAARKSLPSPKLEVSVTETTCGTWSDGSLEIRVTAELSSELENVPELPPSFYCRLKKRGDDGFFRSGGDLRPSFPGSTYTSIFRFSPDMVRAMKDSTVDATLETYLLGRCVITRLPLTAPVGAPLEAYATVHGNLSLRPVRPAPAVVTTDVI